MPEPYLPIEEFYVYFDLSESTQHYRPEFLTELPDDKIAICRRGHIGDKERGLIEIARPSDIRRIAAQYAALDVMFVNNLLPAQQRGIEL